MAPTPRTTDFGARLREARERRGLSPAKLRTRRKSRLARSRRLNATILRACLAASSAVRLHAYQSTSASIRRHHLRTMARLPGRLRHAGHPRTRDKSILDELEQDSKASRWPAVGWLAVIGVVVAALLTYRAVLDVSRQEPAGVPSSACRCRPRPSATPRAERARTLRVGRNADVGHDSRRDGIRTVVVAERWLRLAC